MLWIPVFKRLQKSRSLSRVQVKESTNGTLIAFPSKIAIQLGIKSDETEDITIQSFSHLHKVNLLSPFSSQCPCQTNPNHLSHPTAGMILVKGYIFHRRKDFWNKCNKEKLKVFYFPLNLQTTYSIHLVNIAVHVLFWGMLIIAMTVSETLAVHDTSIKEQ